MALTITTARSAPTAAELIGVGVFSDLDRPDSLPNALLDARGFDAKLGKAMTVEADGGLVVVIGLGKSDEFTEQSLRRAGAALAKTARRQKVIATTLLTDAASVVNGMNPGLGAQCLAEGLELGRYVHGTYKSKAPRQDLKKVTIVGSTAKAVKDGVGLGQAIAAGQVLARDFVNEPGGSLTPAEFAKQAAAMAKKSGLSCKVMDLAAIKKAKLGGLLGVNRGSDNHPRFVELTYSPPKPKATIAFVGKGITFDAGGLSIKPGNGMMTMKMDMGGAAAVIGAMSCLSAAKVPVRVRAYVPMTDNMLGGDATRPGDVLKIRNGKTIEVLNTDAEGRLILADALSLASEAKPDAIVDLATLTGAAVGALGPKIAALMSNDEEFAEKVEGAASDAGERVWRLPLPADYKSQMDSPIADMKNIGKPMGGGALTAGLILQEFVGEGIPWVHLDIAGPAWTDGEDVESRKGGTGFGVRTLVELARSW